MLYLTLVEKSSDEILQKGMKLAADAMGENGVIDFKKIEYQPGDSPILSRAGRQQVRMLLKEYPKVYGILPIK